MEDLANIEGISRRRRGAPHLTLDDFRSRAVFPPKGSKLKRHDGHEAFECQCPSCARNGRDQKGRNHLVVYDAGDYIRLRCVVDCREEAVLAAWDLKPEDLRVSETDRTTNKQRTRREPAPAPSAAPTSPRPEGKFYYYHSAAGDILFRKERRYSWVKPQQNDDGAWVPGYWKKTFSQQAYVGNGEYGNSCEDMPAESRFVLYRLPEVLKAIEEGKPIVVCEGEKAVDRLWEEGHPATCQPDGGDASDEGAKWKPHYTEILSRAPRVDVVADRDWTGSRYAYHVYRALSPSVETRILRSATKREHDDAYDHLAAGLPFQAMEESSPNELRSLFDGIPNPEPVEAPSPRIRRHQTLEEAEAEDDIPMLIEDLLGERERWMLFGRPGSGKSFVGIDFLVTCITGGIWAGKFEVVRPLKVVYYSSEGSRSIKRRFRAAVTYNDVDPQLVRDNLRLCKSVPQLFSTEGQRGIWSYADELEEEEFAPDIVLFDTLSKATLGSKETDNSDAALICDTLAKLNERLRCASGLIHHTGWDTDHPRGASAYFGDMDLMMHQVLDADEKKAEEQRNKRNGKKSDDEEETKRGPGPKPGKLKCFKTKDVEEFEDIPLVLTPHDGTAVIRWTNAVPREFNNNTLGKIMAQMFAGFRQEWWTPMELAHLIEAKEDTVRATLRREIGKGIESQLDVSGDDRQPRYRLRARQ